MNLGIKNTAEHKYSLSSGIKVKAPVSEHHRVTKSYRIMF